MSNDEIDFQNLFLLPAPNQEIGWIEKKRRNYTKEMPTIEFARQVG